MNASKFDEESIGGTVSDDLGLLWNGEEVKRRMNRGVIGGAYGEDLVVLWEGKCGGGYRCVLC